MSDCVTQVVEAGLCTGCGLCENLFGAGQVQMQMAASGYLRPVVLVPLSKSPQAASQQAEFERTCPGRGLRLEPEQDVPVHEAWGPLKSVSTGWATDPATRYQGSSGGVLSALLADLLESGQADFVAHIEADAQHPLRNQLRLSRNRAEVLQGAGSRYGPSAPLKQLDALFATGQRFAFVGKPCDAAALRAHLREHPQRAAQVVGIFAFMCAGVPSEHGSVALLQRLGTQLDQVARFSYRGNGWPGMATATGFDGAKHEMDYSSSWGQVLNRHLQFRCKVCPDGTGEFADVVCADAWYGADGYPDFTERDGRSLILARTARGQELLQSALTRGGIESAPCDAAEIAKMQPYQLARKRLLAGRLLALALAGRQRPGYQGLRLWANAKRLGLVEHLRNIKGTLARLPGSGGI